MAQNSGEHLSENLFPWTDNTWDDYWLPVIQGVHPKSDLMSGQTRLLLLVSSPVSGYILWGPQCSAIQSKILFFRTTTYLLGWVSRPLSTQLYQYLHRVFLFNIFTQTMVQACLYPLGRSAAVFEDPLRFDPGRWGKSREEGQKGVGTGFRSLAFGFGARQCVGRRIAENEMQLLLMHVGDRI